MFLPLSTVNSDQDSEELKQWRTKTEAVVIRVAGGRITPALPGIIGIDTLLNFRETMIIHHTGTSSFSCSVQIKIEAR